MFSCFAQKGSFLFLELGRNIIRNDTWEKADQKYCTRNTAIKYIWQAKTSFEFSRFAKRVFIHLTLLATVDDCRSVADQVHCETMVVAVSPMLTWREICHSEHNSMQFWISSLFPQRRMPCPGCQRHGRRGDGPTKGHDSKGKIQRKFTRSVFEGIVAVLFF